MFIHSSISNYFTTLFTLLFSNIPSTNYLYLLFYGSFTYLFSSSLLYSINSFFVYTPKHYSIFSFTFYYLFYSNYNPYLTYYLLYSKFYYYFSILTSDISFFIIRQYLLTSLILSSIQHLSFQIITTWIFSNNFMLSFFLTSCTAHNSLNLNINYQ